MIDAAFKAPTNDHLRQLEFIVVRGRESITKVIAPLAKNMAAFRKLVFEVDESGDKDKMAMFADALPKQQKMLMESGLLIIPFFRQKTHPLLRPAEQSSLNYFASAWCALENMLLAAANEGLGAAFHIPVSDEAGKIKEIVNAPEGYEFICLLRSRSAHVVPFDEGIAGSGLAVRSPSPFLRALSVGAVVRTSAEKYLILSKDSP